jgi:CheY-like chemotaxis protein
LIAGRKLLLADDSIAIQKVVDLTFTDEGMEVTTVGSGQDALDKLNYIKPDVVLADVYMPGIDGYELCKYIKKSERFHDIPVILLIGSFEPFNEADAKNAGADDIVTKPFQSIRQLVNRVGMLLGGRDDSETVDHETASGPPVSASEWSATVDHEAVSEPPASAREWSAPDYVTQSSEDAAAFSYQPSALAGDEQSNVRVFVEAPMMPEADEAATEHYCPPDLDLQTADTRQLEPVDEIAPNFGAGVSEIDDSVKVDVAPAMAGAASIQGGTSAPQQDMTYQMTQTEVLESFDEGVLDLGEVDRVVSAEAEDDFVLDVDVEAAPAATGWERVSDEPAGRAEPREQFVVPAQVETASQAAMADTQEWTASTPFMESMPKPMPEPAPMPATAAPVSEVSPASLSPEMIEAISRRVVEQLSEKVVREIAWQVVPELSELLIKKKLEETK